MLLVNKASQAQSTLYNMRWNPMNPGKSPQYATDVNWASAQTEYIYNQVKKIQATDPSYSPLFIVPKYK